jgi:hypothetical protein
MLGGGVYFFTHRINIFSPVICCTKSHWRAYYTTLKQCEQKLKEKKTVDSKESTWFKLFQETGSSTVFFISMNSIITGIVPAS